MSKHAELSVRDRMAVAWHRMHADHRWRFNEAQAKVRAELVARGLLPLELSLCAGAVRSVLGNRALWR